MTEDNNTEIPASNERDIVTSSASTINPHPGDSGRRDFQFILSSCGVGCLFSIFVAVFLTFVIVLTGVNTFNGIVDSIKSIFRPAPTTAEIRTSQTLVQSIQPLGQFVSVSAQLAKADIRVQVREGFQNACGRTAIHVAQGAIEAGIDLTQLRPEHVIFDPTTESYNVMLPPPQLTSCRIEYFDQYSRSSSACGPAWDSIERLGQYVALTEFRDDSIEGGILQRASDEARTSLGIFLGMITGRPVNISFAEADPNANIFPPSCQPNPPGNWQYDSERDIWEN